MNDSLAIIEHTRKLLLHKIMIADYSATFELGELSASACLVDPTRSDHVSRYGTAPVMEIQGQCDHADDPVPLRLLDESLSTSRSSMDGALKNGNLLCETLQDKSLHEPLDLLSSPQECCRRQFSPDHTLTDMQDTYKTPKSVSNSIWSAQITSNDHVCTDRDRPFFCPDGTKPSWQAWHRDTDQTNAQEAHPTRISTMSSSSSHTVPYRTIVIRLDGSAFLTQMAVMSFFGSFGKIHRFEQVSDVPFIMLLEYFSISSAQIAMLSDGQKVQGQQLQVGAAGPDLISSCKSPHESDFSRSSLRRSDIPATPDHIADPPTMQRSLEQQGLARQAPIATSCQSSVGSICVSDFLRSEQGLRPTPGPQQSWKPINANSSPIDFRANSACTHSNFVSLTASNARKMLSKVSRVYPKLSKSCTLFSRACDSLDVSKTNSRLSSNLSQTTSCSSASLIKPHSRNKIDLDMIALRMETRTTVMLKNIPNKISQEVLKEWIDQTNEKTYDFLYLRIDFKNRCNVGYAFINFIDPMAIISFVQARLGTTWLAFASEKICDVVYANIQSKAALVEKFRNSCVMDEQDSYRPHIYYSAGPNLGMEEPFPGPNDLSKKARSAHAAAIVGLFCPHGTNDEHTLPVRSSSTTPARNAKWENSRFRAAIWRSVSRANAASSS